MRKPPISLSVNNVIYEQIAVAKFHNRSQVKAGVSERLYQLCQPQITNRD